MKYLRLVKDGELPLGIDTNTIRATRGDGVEAGPWLVYGYGSGAGRGSPGKAAGDGKGFPYSSELSGPTRE